MAAVVLDAPEADTLTHISAPISDWKRACISAGVLTALAAAIVFGIRPGGFEGQGAWLLVLLPASLAAYPVSDYVHKIAPREEPVVFWILVLAFNFFWYWGISYAVMKIRRFLGAS